MTPPDPFDADLSAVHTAVDNLGPWLAIWQARREPDAHARRCASQTVGAIDATLAGLHGIRARLVTETREADDQAAARVDELLARTRDGPREALGSRQPPSTAARSDAEAMPFHGTAQRGSGPAPREATP